jgi:hypothetical protein
MRVTPARVVATLAAALLLALAALFVTPREARTQQPGARDTAATDTTQMYVLRTRDGSLFVGRLTRASVDSVYFVSSGGPIAVPRSAVVELRRLGRGAMRQGVYWAPNPNDTRLFFAPTGRMLAKGEGYFSDTWVFFLLVAGGITNRFTFGGGFSVLPFEDFTQNVFYVTPKFGLVQRPDFNVAVGALVGVAGIADVDAGPGGIVYGVATLGSPDASVTFGTGFVFAESDFGEEPLLMLGGERRIARRVSLATENYLIPGESVGLISYGVRIFGERMSVDLAFANPLGVDSNLAFPGWPYVSFAVKF